MTPYCEQRFPSCENNKKLTYHQERQNNENNKKHWQKWKTQYSTI